MFPITQEAEIWNITSLDMYLDTHKVSSNSEKFFFVSKKNACFLSIEKPETAESELPQASEENIEREPCSDEEGTVHISQASIDKLKEMLQQANSSQDEWKFSRGRVAAQQDERR